LNYPAAGSRHHTTDGFPIGLAAVDDDPLGPAVPLECLSQKPLGRSQIAPLTEPEFDCVTVAVDCAVKKHPTATDLDVSFVDVPPISDRSLAAIEPLQQLGRLANNPAMHRRMVNGDTALGHHLLKIAQAQVVSQIPPHAEQDHGFVELPALEHCVSPYCGLNAVAETLKQKVCHTSLINPIYGISGHADPVLLT
jgi:hypothetical protein